MLARFSSLYWGFWWENLSIEPENLTPDEPMSLKLYIAIHISDSPTLDRPDRRQVQPPRLSIRLLSFICEHLQKNVVPVGPRFQADALKWNGLVKKSVLNPRMVKKIFHNSRWLGTKFWPIKDGPMETRGRMNGKGRPALVAVWHQDLLTALDDTWESIYFNGNLAPLSLVWSSMRWANKFHNVSSFCSAWAGKQGHL